MPDFGEPGVLCRELGVVNSLHVELVNAIRQRSSAGCIGAHFLPFAGTGPATMPPHILPLPGMTQVVHSEEYLRAGDVKRFVHLIEPLAAIVNQHAVSDGRYSAAEVEIDTESFL